MRVLAYIRVSGAEQGRHGTSLDAQRDEIERHCRASGLPEPIVYVEIESAGAEKLARRAQIRALLADVQPGDLVVVAKQDRWSRDTLFYVQSTREIVARGARFLSLAERFDPSTPEGAFAATVMAATAEHERARIHARTVGRRKELRAQGCWVEGPPPFGYRVQQRRLVVELDEAAIVVAIYERSARGESVAQIVEWLRPSHPRLAYRKTVLVMLRARWYRGELRLPSGAWVLAHPPIVTPELAEAAAAGLVSRRLGGMRPSSTSRTATWLARGLAVCARCGARMGAAYGPGDRDYYACGSRARRRGCEQPYARVPVVDTELRRVTLERLTALRSELAREGPVPAPARSAVETLRRRSEQAEARRARTIDLMTDGTIEPADGRARLARIDEDRARLAVELAAEERRTRAASPTQRRAVLADVTTLERAWSAAPPEAQREILRRLAERIEIDAGQPAVTWRDVADLARA